jgi:hypothetical protein
MKEDHSSNPNNYPIFRPNILGNPFTHIKDRNTKASYVVSTRDEAVERYSRYFDAMYGSNIKFTLAVDEIYEKYKNGEDVYLECYCHPLKCHGDVIADKLRKRLIKEKLNNR